jgi:hypothetical protein
MTKVLQRLIEDILGVIFVYSIIGEMHVQILQIFLICRLVLLSGKSDQPLIIDVHPQRVTTGNQRINPQIELQPLVQERVVNVGLYNALPMTLDFSDILINVHERD